MSETAGCGNCGNPRFDPVDVTDDGDMILKCRECGEKLLLRNFLPTDSPNKDGDVFSKKCIKGLREDMRRAQSRQRQS
jgi:DNA-directed RNA polymerase subunit RPC12/RpoP